MTAEATGNPKATPAQGVLEGFFQSLTARTSDPTHLRLLKAARRGDPSGALERELARIMEELLHET
jgi:hypothetical protein